MFSSYRYVKFLLSSKDSTQRTVGIPWRRCVRVYLQVRPFETILFNVRRVKQARFASVCLFSFSLFVLDEFVCFASWERSGFLFVLHQ